MPSFNKININFIKQNLTIGKSYIFSFYAFWQLSVWVQETKLRKTCIFWLRLSCLKLWQQPYYFCFRQKVFNLTRYEYCHLLFIPCLIYRFSLLSHFYCFWVPQVCLARCIHFENFQTIVFLQFLTKVHCWLCHPR